MRPNIGIVGQGFVGGSVHAVLSEHERIGSYDIDSTKSNVSSLDKLIDQSDIIFVCLPTPMRESGECYVGIVEETLSYINEYCAGQKIVITKSTVPPGTHSRWNKKYDNLAIVFNPEFLTEANALEDFRTQKYLILGSDDIDKQEAAKQAFLIAFPEASVDYLFCTYEEAEAIKYFRNTFLSVKITFCNEFYEMCKSMGIDYESVSNIAHLDSRLGTSHYMVPGPDGDMGFGGHCFPKDINALIHMCQAQNISCETLKTSWNINTKFRKNYDWLSMEGRAVINNKENK